MKLLLDEAKVDILTPESELKEQLRRIERAGRTCYQSYHGKDITDESSKDFIKMIIRRGHMSVLEHSCITIRFSNVSRGLTHCLVRHRLASYSQESTQYVDYAKRGDTDVNLDAFQIKVVAPPYKDMDKKHKLEDGTEISFKEMTEKTEMFYRALRKDGWLPVEARQILPNGMKTEIVMTANFREWRHVFKMRTSKYSQWELRMVMIPLLEKLKPLVCPIFDDFVSDGKDKRGVEYYKQIKTE